MARIQQAEMESWVAQWPVGSKGIFGGRVKETVKVVGITWERGFPTLELVATTGHTYYCKYGMRRDLSHVESSLRIFFTALKPLAIGRKDVNKI